MVRTKAEVGYVGGASTNQGEEWGVGREREKK